MHMVTQPGPATTPTVSQSPTPITTTPSITTYRFRPDPPVVPKWNPATKCMLALPYFSKPWLLRIYQYRIIPKRLLAIPIIGLWLPEFFPSRTPQLLTMGSRPPPHCPTTLDLWTVSQCVPCRAPPPQQ